MKRNQINKFVNLLSHFSETIHNPVDLVRLNMVFISGKNKYPVEIEIQWKEEKPLYHIPLVGNSLITGPDGFFEMVEEQAEKYDELEICFYERGGGRKITADDRNVRISSLGALERNMDKQNEIDSSHVFHGISGTRNYYIRVDEAPDLLKAIGIIDDKNKILNDKIRKYNQIDRFVELADPLIREFIQRGETVRILDCACGKSYLSFVLNYYIREKCGHPCEFLGLDWSESVISSSKTLAAKLNYTNMKFKQCDLSQYNPVSFKPSICMSLHACDTATDLAIHTGIISGSAAILCVPCCQKELLTSSYSFPDLDKNILRHGLLKARFSDLMTDAMRVLAMEACGYETSVIEYISPLDSPKNIMIKGRFNGKKNHESRDSYHNLRDENHCDITLGKLLHREGLL